MDAEMRSHIEMQTEENIEAGMKPEEARYAALRQFGWVESIKDTCRDQRGVTGIENLAQDVRYGVRIWYAFRYVVAVGGNTPPITKKDLPPSEEGAVYQSHKIQRSPSKEMRMAT